MKIKSLWITALILFFIYIVVRNIPAQWGLALANAPLQLSGISGTVWNGKAETAVLPLDDDSYALGSLQWRLSPISLLTAKPCIDVQTKLDDQMLSGSACVGLDGALQLDNAQISVPAKVAEIIAPIVEVDGEIMLHVESLQLSNNQIHNLRASGSWNAARFYNSTSWVGLGTLGFDLTEDGSGGVNAKILDVDGPLQLQLNSQFNLAGKYDTKGEIHLRPNTPREIVELIDGYTNVSREVQEVLSLFVENRGQGTYSVRWTNPE